MIADRDTNAIKALAQAARVAVETTTVVLADPGYRAEAQQLIDPSHVLHLENAVAEFLIALNRLTNDSDIQLDLQRIFAIADGRRSAVSK